MSSTYPAMLDLSSASVLVIGGGKVAAQKLKGLPEGTRATVVAPALSRLGRSQVRRLDAKVLRRGFRSTDVRGKKLVFVCTDSPQVNARAAEASRKAGAWVCLAAEPARGNFQVPALGHVGRLRFTLSTDGSSPALAKALRKEWERQFRKSSVNWLLAILSKNRARLIASPREKRAVLRAITNKKALELMLAPSTASRRRALRNMMAVLEHGKNRT